MPTIADLNSGEDRLNEQCVESSSQLHQQMTIGTLPDDVLLKIFKIFVDTTYSYYTASEKWCTLVHVCRRWRDLAFTSPRHLNLQLLCGPPRRSVEEMLDIWPELSIFIHDFGCPSSEAKDNVAAALRLNHRVFGIRLDRTSDFTWETFAPLMQHSFPALTHLWVQPYLLQRIAISRSFLGGSAPSLRDLRLVSVIFLALPELLLSSTNLVVLTVHWYNHIPPSGYISPQAMVTGLSALTQLESLSLTFSSPHSFPDRAIRIPPPHTHALLPALTYIHFQGDPEYMEDLVAQIDAPSLESMVITLFHQEVIEVSELAKFVRRTDKLSLLDRAAVVFQRDSIFVTLSQEELEREIGPKTLLLSPARPESDSRLSYLVLFCASLLPTLFPFECLEIIIFEPYHDTWKDTMDDPDAQWLKLLHLFNTVKDLRLCEAVAPSVAQALRGVPGERVLEVLPALEIVFISEMEPFGPVKEAISEFADARQLSSHPVSIHDWE